MGIIAAWMNGRRANRHQRAAELAAANANSALFQYQQFTKNACAAWGGYKAWDEESKRQRDWAAYYSSRNGYITPSPDVVAEVPSKPSPTPKTEPDRGALSVQEMSEKFAKSEPTTIHTPMRQWNDHVVANRGSSLPTRYRPEGQLVHDSDEQEN